MDVGEIMTKDVLTVSKDDKISKLVMALAERGISGAPVVDGAGSLVGICTDTDIMEALKKRYSETKMIYSSIPVMAITFVQEPVDKKVREAFKEVSNLTVENIMTKNVRTVGPDASVSDVVKLMAKHNVNRVPVVDNKKVVGIVSRGDIIKAGSRILVED